ncbi:hypothetical protein F5B20DRAFT_5575 [Whalleya microplaca]|nr:hypothetical protein F5B20DRAFT_5575 [Whalleya microplaca]
MNGQQLAEKTPSGKGTPMKEMWAAAAKAFEDICGESLQRGDVKGFDDVQRMIEGVSKASYGIDGEQENKWDKAKSVGLESLKWLKMLIGTAFQASSIIPIPASAANITSCALCIVFDIPQAIKGYNDAIDQVFNEVSSALSQFEIYKSAKNVDSILIQKIHLVIISFVKLCAHVVKYRQGRKRDRLLRQIKPIFDHDSGLGDEMAEFKRVLQQQRDVEGTVTLAVVYETQHNVAILLEKSVIFEKNIEVMHRLVQETQKDVQYFKDADDRSKTLIKIRDALGVWATVRLDTNTTQTCTSIYDKCLNHTGSWIWNHDAYTAWTAPIKGKETSHVLILTGPASSGKTSASALITKRLEEQKGRTYVAHYFFPASTKKSDEDKTPVLSALKYMAFQLARVDPTVRTPLGKACDAGPGIFRRAASLETLDTLWRELKIGTPGSGATYYLVFDGIENLPNKQTEILLMFVFGPKLAEESAGRVRVLVSGTDDQFTSKPGGAKTNSALRIQIGEHNGSDMRIVINEALTNRGMLEHVEFNSDQQRAWDKIVEKLPQNVSGSYSRLQFGLNDVIRLLSTRTSIRELDRMLDQPVSSHETAIKNLQRSLTADEISELNELLKWVLFCNGPMTLDQLEAAMFLYSGTESLASLQFIIKNKYSTVLKLEDGYVYGQDGVKEYLQKDKDIPGISSQSRDRSTISMTISINNVDQELCGHFFWDLTHKAIRDKFKFDFDAASSNGTLHNTSRAAITVDEFAAHRTIVSRSFKYLDREENDQTKKIGPYIVGWLPFHLGQLRQLEDEEKGVLTTNEKMDIGQNLYNLFKDENVVLRHRASFEQTGWYANEMEDVQKWLMDSAVVRRLDKKWRDKVQLPVSPTRALLKALVKVVAEGLLRKRSWGVENAAVWIKGFMELDEKFQQTLEHLKADEAESSAPTSPSTISHDDDINWHSVSAWCQSILGLPDSELNSLWYERLAEASSSWNCEASTVLSLYEYAIQKGNPSWLCHRSLGKTYFSQGQTQEAIAHVELALKEAEPEGAVPKPEAKDIVGLHLLLGLYAYKAGDVQRSAKHYSFACKSEDPEQASQGQLGCLKARLSLGEAEAIRQLKSIFLKDKGEGTMVSVLNMIARDVEHDFLVFKMFTVAKGDPDLLKRIVRAMEMATAMTALNKDRAVEKNRDHLFAEDETRGVLLYDLGVAAYTYKVASDGTETIGEALRLWKESRNLLSNVGGYNASIARQDATTALAKHYFQDMMDGKHQEHAGTLDALTEADSKDSYGDAASFLGTVYAFYDKSKAKEYFVGWMRQAFQILSDDIPDNDWLGYALVQRTLETCQDFENAAVALSLRGLPDLVTDALFFEAKDIVRENGVDKERLLDMVTKLAKETIQVAKSQVPNFSQQIRRIEAARAHVDSLVDAAGIKPKPEADGDHSEAGGSEIQGIQGILTASELDIAFVHDLLDSRLSTLQRIHSPKIDMEDLHPWFCDGRTPDGRRCENITNFGDEFYHCIYCDDRDFCGGCFARLRDPIYATGITACSAKHRWLRMPPQGGPMYVGSQAKSVRLPREVRPTKDDECVLEICYDENGGEEITVEAWKEALAREWGISPEEIRKMSNQATLDGGEEGLKKI